jgi:L-lactate dehydrogenase complex protein LldF
MQEEVKDHAVLSEKFNRDEDRVNWHDETLWWVRQKRDKAAWSLGDEWEALRNQASQIKNHVLSNLHQYLLDLKNKRRQME